MECTVTISKYPNIKCYLTIVDSRRIVKRQILFFDEEYKYLSVLLENRKIKALEPVLPKASYNKIIAMHKVMYYL